VADPEDFEIVGFRAIDKAPGGFQTRRHESKMILGPTDTQMLGKVEYLV
jgi:hypothetical protein